MGGGSGGVSEELLTTSWTLIHAPDVSAAVKADLIKSTVKWGNLEPQKDAIAEGTGGGGVTIQINLPSQESAVTTLVPVAKVIEHG